MPQPNKKETFTETERRALPFLVEFVKFSAAFSFIIALGLFSLSFASGVGQ